MAVKEPSALGDMAPLLVQSRFRVTQDRDEWFTRMRAAFAVLAESTGFHRGWIGQATDDAELVTLTTQWEGIGAYRKALSRFEVKAEVIPLLSAAIDEPTAYEAVVVQDAGEAKSFASGPEGRRSRAAHRQHPDRALARTLRTVRRQPAGVEARKALRKWSVSCLPA